MSQTQSFSQIRDPDPWPAPSESTPPRSIARATLSQQRKGDAQQAQSDEKW